MTLLRIIAVLAIAVSWAMPSHAQQSLPGDPPAAKPAPRVVVRSARAHKPKALPPHELSQPLLFKILLAEIAAQRAQYGVAVQTYLEAARETRDPRIAQRATEVAWNAHLVGPALEAASIWLQADAESKEAQQILAALLVSQSRLADAQPHLERWLAADAPNAGHAFLQLNALLSRYQDRAAALALTQTLAKPYPQVPEAHLAVAQAAFAAEQEALALEEVRAALKLKPDWEGAALLQARLLQRQSNAEAIASLKEFLARNPQSPDARLTYARLLVSDKQYGAARGEFQALLEAFPDNADVAMAVALLSLQLSDYDAAEDRLKRALDNNYKDPDAARFYLGQVSEERKRFDDALKWYGSVARGDQYVAARGRYAAVLAKQGRLAEARQSLQDAADGNPQLRIPLLQAEAQILRDAGEYRTVFDMLGTALAKNPDSAELLYDHAMAAEKVDRIDVLEGNLKKLIELKPDHAHAYNALGYTFADRNLRLSEAYELIDKALKLSPDDASIMDSMGWVLFRMGRLEESVSWLQRAYTLRPDAEIAAHLGEVLWVLGRQGEARRLWTDSLKEHPGNDILQATLKRLDPNP